MSDITGYRVLTDADRNVINRIKSAEIDLGTLWRQVRDSADVSVTPDPRWLAVAKTHFEEGFSALVRAVAQPEQRF